MRKALRRIYQLNQYIRAKEVRVVDEEGKQLGVMPISEALKLAQEEGVDLVEVAPKITPPVAKLIDFAKQNSIEGLFCLMEDNIAPKSMRDEVHN